jgi:hypothetical protein
MNIMKTLWRTLLILAVAGLIAGGLYGYVNSSGASLGATAGEGRHIERGGTPPEVGEGRPARGGGERAGGHDGLGGEASGFSLFGLSGVLTQAGKVGLITLVIVAAQAVVKWIRRRPRKQAAAA